ncbi:MAG: PAS domain S-box protein [Desulfovibrionaceae bacterium]|nr:PAS domain S-box protein [Desulfovibrionaceae bacterium]
MARNNPPGTSFRFHWLILAIALTLFCAYAALNLYRDRLGLEARERARLLTQARVIEANLSLQLEGAALALKGVGEELAGAPPGGSDVNRKLRILKAAMPGVRTLIVLDKDGGALYSNREELLGASLGERDYFRKMRSDPAPAKLTLSPPFKTVLGSWAMTLSLPLAGQSGGFAGLVTATLDPEFFKTLLGSVNSTADMRSAVIHGDGQMYLTAPEIEELRGKNLIQPGSFFTRHLESGSRESFFTGKSESTGEDRMVAIVTVNTANPPMDKPLVVSVSRDLAATHAVWRAEARGQAATFGVIAALSCAALAAYHRRQRAHDRDAALSRAKLRESEQRARAITDSAQDAILMLDPAGMISFWNPAAERILGYSASEALGADLHGLLMPPRYAQAFAAGYAAFQRDGTGAVLEKTIEITARRKDGAEIPISLSISALWRDEGWCAVGILRDITEEKRAADELRREGELRRAVLDNSAVGIFLGTPERVIVKANKRACEMFGYAREEMEGKNFRLIHVSDESYQAIAALYPQLSGTGLASMDYRYRRKDGSLFWCQISGTALDPDDIGKGVIWTFLDISERKRAENEIKAGAAWLQSLVNILRSPAASLKEVLDDALREALALTGSQLGYIYHYSEERQEFILHAWSEQVMAECSILKPESHYELKNAGLWGEAVRQRGPVMVNDYSGENPLKKGYPAGHAALTRFLTIPVIVEGRIVAVVGVANKDEDYDGADTRCLTLFMDATWQVIGRLRAEEQLNERADFVRFNPAPVLRAAKDGRILRLNPAAEAELGPRRVGTSVYDILPELEGVQPRDIDPDAPLRLEVRLDEKWYAFDAVAGQDDSFFIYGSDISLRKRAQESLKAVSIYTRSLIEANLDLMITNDPDGLIMDVNKAAEDIFGRPRSELIGQHFMQFDANPEKAFESFRETIALGPVTGFPAAIRHASGTITELSLNATVLRDQDGRIMGVLAVGRDVTAQKRLEEDLRRAKEGAEAASRAKGDFLANMSHEIRTPISGLLGMLELAKSAPDMDQCRQWLELGAKAGRSLLLIVNDILDFSKIEAGKLHLRVQPFDVQELVDEVTATVSMLAREKGLALSVSVDPGVPARVIGDQGRLNQILLNLLGNAIKYTDKGSVGLQVALAAPKPGRDETRPTLRFAVADTGIGIPRDKREALFTPFSQVDSSSSKRFQGTGLGLSICKRLVDMMDGEIGVESEPGRGSVFTFTAPLAVAPGTAKTPGLSAASASPAAPAPAAAPARAPDSSGGLAVLLAEDDPINRKFILVTLQNAGHKVVCAANGVEALALTAGTRFDLILMDIQMPRLGGDEAARRIREREASTGDARRTPILALTAYALPEDRARFLSLGIDDCVTKPIDVSEFFAAIARVAPNRRETGDARTAPPETAQDRAGAGFDKAAVDSRFPGNFDFWADLAREFLDKSFPLYVAGLRSGLEQDDMDQAGKAAHTLKGVCGTICAPLAEQLAARAAAAARENDAQTLRDLLDRLEEEKPRLAASLAAVRGEEREAEAGERKEGSESGGKPLL